MGNPNRRTTALVVIVVAALVGAPATATHAGPATDVPPSAGSPGPQQTTTTEAQQTTTIGTDATADDGTATTTTMTTPDHEVSPRPLPERPEPLNTSSVSRYVAAYEEVRKHNEILRETTDVTITSIDVRCGPTSLDEQDGGFVVEVACGFSYEFGRNGTPTGIADGAPYLARYFVNETTTELLGLRSALGAGEALPLSFPEKPSPLNASNVLPYVAAYEKVRKHNELLEETSGTNVTITGTDVFCRPELVEETDDGFLVEVSCGLSYEFRLDENVVGIADGVPYTARYRINETTTELVSVRETFGPNRTTTVGITTTLETETTTAETETTTAGIETTTDTEG